MSMSVQQLSYWYVKFALKWLKTWNGWLTPDKAEKKKKITQGSYEFKKSVGSSFVTMKWHLVHIMCHLCVESQQMNSVHVPTSRREIIPSQNSALCTLMSII